MSHDTMPTFFSGTDLNTLQKEGFDRNCFVSLIVNNAGEYTAAITRKVEYTEKHNIEITGSYPFFGTGRILELPVSRATDEKKKVVIEYFDLTVEKHSVTPEVDEYSARFFELASNKTRVSNVPSVMQSPFSGLYSDSDEDDVYPINNKVPKTQGVSTPHVVQKELFPNKAKLTRQQLFGDEEFDEETINLAMSTPIIPYKLNELLLQILTGCPIIGKWVKTSEITTKLFNEVLVAFKNNGFTQNVYTEFVYSSLSNIFQSIEPEDYFAKTAYANNQDMNTLSPYIMENILVIRMISMIGEFDATDVCLGALEAFQNYYSI